MWYTGLSANLTSLGGLAISIGMMVDATVVMVENIYRHLEEHREHSMRETVLVAAQEIGRPMFFAILIIIAVFLPVFTLQGIEGKLFKPLAYAVSFSMFGSLLMAAMRRADALRPLAQDEERRAASESDHPVFQVDLCSGPEVDDGASLHFGFDRRTADRLERLQLLFPRQRISSDDRRREHAGPCNDAGEHLADACGSRSRRR
jgi:hypothetical protein